MDKSTELIRSYRDDDYEKLKKLYLRKELYGGIFDEARDGRQRLAKKTVDDPEAILIYEKNGDLLGTISIIEDGRIAWLYRFIVKDFDPKVTKALYDKAVKTLKHRGHMQMLIYSSTNNIKLDDRYKNLGMHRGGDYTCFWQEI